MEDIVKNKTEQKFARTGVNKSDRGECYSSLGNFLQCQGKC